MVCSAALIVFASGVFMTTTPRLVAAEISILSTPTPALPITDRLTALLIIFEFKMEQQSGSCDGPDLIGEGTMLQYRVGPAPAIWQDVTTTMWPFNLNPMPYTNKAYFCPINPALQSFTNWNQYSIPIPAAAFSANTQFRWRQISPTSANWDFWGLDNVNISPSSPGGATYT